MKAGGLGKTIVAALVLAGIAVTAYSGALNHPFLWDDLKLVRDNPRIQNNAPLETFFSAGIASYEGATAFYRPLQMMSYALDHRIWKSNPFGYHLTNVILHALCAVGVFFLILDLFSSRRLAFLTSLLFAVHPIHTEAIAYISGRADPLYALFGILMLLFYVRANQKQNGCIEISISTMFFILALLSKEAALSFFGLIAIYHFVFGKPVRLKPLLPLICVALAYLFLRSTGALQTYKFEEPVESTWTERIPGAFAAITNYVKLLSFPAGLHMAYGQKIFSFFDMRVLIGVTITAGLLTAAVRFRKSCPALSFGLLWFFAALLPILNLYPLNAYMAEHWLYLPSIGFFIAAAFLLDFLFADPNTKSAALIATIALTGFFAAMTVRQNRVWSDPVTLFTHTLKYEPRSFRALNNLGLSFVDAGQAQKALPYYMKALEVKPDDALIHYNLALAYDKIGDNTKALAHYQRSAELGPDSPDTFNDMGILLERMDRFKEAVDALSEAIRLQPLFLKAYNNLGNVLSKLGRKDEAIVHYKDALKINPLYASARYNLALVLDSMGKTDEAAEHYVSLLKLEPNRVAVLNDLGVILARKGQYEQAEKLFRRAVQLAPERDDVRQNLSHLLTAKRNADK